LRHLWGCGAGGLPSWLRYRLLLAGLNLAARWIRGREIFVRGPGRAKQHQRAQHHREDQILAVVHVCSILLRDWVVALAAPWVATKDALQSHPSAACGAIAFYCGNRIGRAAGLIAAARRKNLRRAFLPALPHQDHPLPDNGLRSLSSALVSSERSRP